MSAGCGALRSAASRRTRPTRTGSCWRRPCFSFPRARCRFVANRADKTCCISLKNPRVGYSAAMAEVLLVLLLAIEIAFAVLAIRTVAAWIHQPDRRHGNLAIAIGSLAIVMLLAPSLTGTGANTQLLTDLAAVIFLVSGYGLLMFRDSFVPFGVAKTRLVTLLIVAVGLLDIAVQLPADPESPHNAVQSLALVSTVGVWAFCILEPIVTFWIASRGRPEVEKARLRAISAGYAGLLLVVLIGTVAGTANDALSVVIDLFALATVPVLYVAFFPPVWLRRIWRQPEEDQFRNAMHDLLLYSPERATTDFLNVASHELRGPMTVIKGYLTMLEAGALGELSPKARSVLPLLISKSDEVNWMVEQMIEASRLEEGRLALKRQHVDIVELTDSAIDGVRMLLSDHDLKVDAPVEAIEAEVDPDRFQIVVRNLLSNAAKYSPAGTDITVDVRRVDSQALVSVTDRGVGIAESDQEQLFSRFGRIESSVHVQGTGLGLWLSREIARMHDGDLTVTSTLGEGSTFRFTVPVSN